jgi:hypothetical protein
MSSLPGDEALDNPFLRGLGKKSHRFPARLTIFTETTRCDLNDFFVEHSTEEAV